MNEYKITYNWGDGNNNGNNWVAYVVAASWNDAVDTLQKVLLLRGIAGNTLKVISIESMEYPSELVIGINDLKVCQ